MDQRNSNNVLLIEDDELVASSIVSLLLSRGIGVSTFRTAEEFIQSSANQPIGTIIVDVDLGHDKLSGLELIRWIRNKSWNNPIIVLSGKLTVPQAVEAMRESVSDVIDKPTSIPKLLAAVQASFSLDHRADRNSQELYATLETLSKNERSILDMLLAGASNKAIASRLDVGLRSAVRYRKTLLDAFGFKTIPELAVALGAAGIGPTQITAAPPIIPSTIPAQQRSEIRERIAVLAKILKDAQQSNSDALKSAVANAAIELEKLSEHPHLVTAQQSSTQPSILIVYSEPNCCALLRDLMRAYGLFAEGCTSLEEAIQFVHECRANPPAIVLQIESKSLPFEKSGLLSSYAPPGCRQRHLFLSENGVSRSQNDAKITLLPGKTQGLELVQIVIEELRKMANEKHPL